MNTITITLTDGERKRLIFFAEEVIKGGHWGNAMVEIPEEAGLLDLFRQFTGSIELSMSQAAMLLDWFMEGTGNGLVMLGEDISILQKLAYKLYGHYNYRKEACVRELEIISGLIARSGDLLPGKEFNLPMDYLRELEEIERNEGYRRLKLSIDAYDTGDDDVTASGTEGKDGGDTTARSVEAKEPLKKSVRLSGNIGETERKDVAVNDELEPADVGEARKSFFSGLFGTEKKSNNAGDTRSVGESIDAKELLKKTERLARKIGKKGRK